MARQALQECVPQVDAMVLSSGIAAVYRCVQECMLRREPDEVTGVLCDPGGVPRLRGIETVGHVACVYNQCMTLCIRWSVTGICALVSFSALQELCAFGSFQCITRSAALYKQQPGTPPFALCLREEYR